jgi:hypothetical protein
MAKATATLTAKTTVKANAIHIKARRTKHGPGRRYWGQREYARAAIGVLYPDGLPLNIANAHAFKAMLVERVRKKLRKDPAYQDRRFKKEVSRNTVLRAAELSS